ncbi:MAG: NAD(P)-binding domain-containing protein, partial [Betaproteobacteria bacterium]|nr:NAD(P)-binding domain-containing protein [Betaproteobacteria bacterium]
MAAALLRGAQAAGILEPAQIAVAEPVEQLRRQWEQAGCQTVADASQLPEAAAYLLCVKPQDLAAAAGQLAGSRNLAKALTVSIVAGARVETLTRLLDSSLIVRTMPNTPAQIGEGCTFAYAAPAAVAGKEPVGQLFASVGKLLWVERENLIDAATAVAGSGPAYAFALIEAMTAAGKKLGLE